MESNSIVTAPMISDVDSLYDYWRQMYYGSKSSFYEFMTVPSIDRDRFMSACSMDYVRDGKVVMLFIGQNVGHGN